MIHDFAAPVNSAFYGGLLTDKQRQVLTLHCEEDLSLTEIAQEVGSRGFA